MRKKIVIAIVFLVITVVESFFIAISQNIPNQQTAISHDAMAWISEYYIHNSMFAESLQHISLKDSEALLSRHFKYVLAELKLDKAYNSINASDMCPNQMNYFNELSKGHIGLTLRILTPGDQFIEIKCN